MPRVVLLAVLAVSAVALSACGASSDGGSDVAGGSAAAGDGASPKPLAPSTKGLPAKLAANVEDADQIVGEGEEAFFDRLDSLEGHPVVVNQWASWCESCRFEFPFFRAAAERYRDRVAFVGLDAQDDRDDAEAFLEELPFGMPSVFDPDASVSAALGGGASWPTTFFLDAEGEVVNVKIGAYATPELLAADIEKFALGRKG